MGKGVDKVCTESDQKWAEEDQLRSWAGEFFWGFVEWVGLKAFRLFKK